MATRVVKGGFRGNEWTTDPLALESQLPHKFANLFFSITNRKNKMTDLWGVDSCQTAVKTLCVR